MLRKVGSVNMRAGWRFDRLNLLSSRRREPAQDGSHELKQPALGRIPIRRVPGEPHAIVRRVGNNLHLRVLGSPATGKAKLRIRPETVRLRRWKADWHDEPDAGAGLIPSDWQ